jgi:hypothetical protein
MTRKDYDLIVSIYAETLKTLSDAPAVNPDTARRFENTLLAATCRQLAAGNANFDSQKFLAAIDKRLNRKAV